MRSDRWFMRMPGPDPTRAPSVRLFAFPFAGGGATAFRPWGGVLGPEVELWAALLPGREGRFAEPPWTDLDELVRALVTAMEPLLVHRYALFGHSMGALTAFLVAKELRTRGHPAPTDLIVSGHRAPHRPDRGPIMHTLPEDDFLQKIRDFDGTPAAVLENEELLGLLLPILRADFTLCERYEHAPGAPLESRILAFGGLEDADVDTDDVEAWSEYTAADFDHSMFAGGHFFLLDPDNAIPTLVKDRLIR